MIRIQRADGRFRIMEWDEGDDPLDAVCLDEILSVESLLEMAIEQRRRASEMVEAVDALLGIRRCRVCRCTDDDCSGCIDRTGLPCSWVTERVSPGDRPICSACVPGRPVVVAWVEPTDSGWTIWPTTGPRNNDRPRERWLTQELIDDVRVDLEEQPPGILRPHLRERFRILRWIFSLLRR